MERVTKTTPTFAEYAPPMGDRAQMAMHEPGSVFVSGLKKGSAILPSPPLLAGRTDWRGSSGPVYTCEGCCLGLGCQDTTRSVVCIHCHGRYCVAKQSV